MNSKLWDFSNGLVLTPANPRVPLTSSGVLLLNLFLLSYAKKHGYQCSTTIQQFLEK